jgi:uncharacterized protein YecE (DUF72 family)
MQVHIGTSGWQYDHWKGLFYPETLKKADWLSFYARHFDTLEINASFYRDVRLSTHQKWYTAVPDNFLFSIKMSKFITHIKRLKIDSESIHRFTGNALQLNEKLGVVPIQLPPGLTFDEQHMRDFLGLLNKQARYTIEARNKTFIDERLFSLLERFEVAWCIADSAGRFPYYETVTAPFVYIRLHGSQRLYASDYSKEELETWRDRIVRWDKETFVYFDNDYFGYAVKNARDFQQLFSA